MHLVIAADVQCRAGVRKYAFIVDRHRGVDFVERLRILKTILTELT